MPEFGSATGAITDAVNIIIAVGILGALIALGA